MRGEMRKFSEEGEKWKEEWSTNERGRIKVFGRSPSLGEEVAMEETGPMERTPGLGN